MARNTRVTRQAGLGIFGPKKNLHEGACGAKGTTQQLRIELSSASFSERQRSALVPLARAASASPLTRSSALAGSGPEFVRPGAAAVWSAARCFFCRPSESGFHFGGLHHVD